MAKGIEFINKHINIHIYIQECRSEKIIYRVLITYKLQEKYLRGRVFERHSEKKKNRDHFMNISELKFKTLVT